MAANYKVRGVQKRHEQDAEKIFRDSRRLGEKIGAAFEQPKLLGPTLLGLGFFAVVYPALLEIMFLIWGIMYLVFGGATKQAHLPMRMPFDHNGPDYNDPLPGRRLFGSKFRPSRGIFFLGNDKQTNEELHLTADDMLTHMLLFGTTGAGKAQPLTARVCTPTGWVAMGDIKQGDRVSTPDGGSAQVAGIFPQGKIPIYRITFADGRSTEACGEHLWEVHHKHWHGKYKKGISRAGAARPRIISTHEIAGLLERNKGTFSVRLPQPVEFQEQSEALPLDPYVVGALIGDGSLGRTIRFSSKDSDVVERMRERLPDDCILVQYESHAKNRPYDFYLKIRDDDAPKGRDTDGRYYRSSVKDALIELGLYETHAHTKFIPAVYKTATVEQRWLLLQGLMDTDGTADGRHTSITYSTVSETLAADVADLVRSLGGIAKVNTRQPTFTNSSGEKTNGRLAYVVSIRIATPKACFLSERKRARVKKYQYADSLKLRIESVELVGAKDAQCILIDHPEHLYITDDYVVTHNTEALLSLSWNSISMGSGLIFIDPKGTSKLGLQVYTLARLCGREDDFLEINFSTGNKDVDGVSASRMSNTANPFAFGTADSLAEQLVSLIPTSEGENAIFSERAISLIYNLMRPLVDLRNKKLLELSISSIRDHLTLKACMDLVENPNISDNSRKAMQAYLGSVAGYQEGKAYEQQSEDTHKQFGYAQAYFTRAMSSLIDTYGHVYGATFGEVSYPDVVFNRRILVILLPAMEKPPSEIKNLGKIILSAIRGAMSLGLGDKFEGTKEEMLDSLPTASNVPNLVIADEYGYVATEGFSVTAAQARGLGFSCVFAGQDYAGFKRGSETEAEQILANTKVKIIMALEDAQATLEVVKAIGGEGYVTNTSGFTMDQNSMSSSYRDMMNVSVEKRGRVDINDLRDQIEGEFHVFHKANMVRGQMFHADPPIKSAEMQINRLLEVGRPSAQYLSTKYGAVRELTTAFRTVLKTGLKDTSESDPKIDHMVGLLANAGVVKGMGRNEAALVVAITKGYAPATPAPKAASIKTDQSTVAQPVNKSDHAAPSPAEPADDSDYKAGWSGAGSTTTSSAAGSTANAPSPEGKPATASGALDFIKQKVSGSSDIDSDDQDATAGAATQVVSDILPKPSESTSSGLGQKMSQFGLSMSEIIPDDDEDDDEDDEDESDDKPAFVLQELVQARMSRSVGPAIDRVESKMMGERKESGEKPMSERVLEKATSGIAEYPPKAPLPNSSIRTSESVVDTLKEMINSSKHSDSGVYTNGGSDD